MKRRVIALVCMLGAPGCAQILGLEDLHPRDAGTQPDASADATVDAAACTSFNLHEAIAIDDTFLLLGSNPDYRFGATDTVNIGQSGNSRVLLRFDLKPEMVDALTSSALDAMTLVVTLRASGGACTTTCPNTETTFRVYALTDGWNEGDGTIYSGANWMTRIGTSTIQTAWEIAGANGASDRSDVPLGTVMVSAAEASGAGQITRTFPLSPQLRDEMAARRAGTYLSLILLPTSGGTLFLFSNEGLASPSILQFRVCS